LFFVPIHSATGLLTEMPHPGNEAAQNVLGLPKYEIARCSHAYESATYFNAFSKYKKFIGPAAWCIIHTVTKQRTVRLRKRSSSGMMILVARSAFVRIWKEQNEN